jgi:PAS domain S-box-containing protein
MPHERFSMVRRSRVGRRILLAACLSVGMLFSATAMMALDPSVANSQYALSSWTSDDGLPQNGVSEIAQTPDGYLWFATEEGLARFDGARFTTFFPRKTVYALLVSRDGSLWISVNGGLSRYKDHRMTQYSTRDGLRESAITSMSEAPDGSLWMATRLGMNRYHGGTFSTFSVTDGSATSWIDATCVTRDGALWFGMNGGGLKRLYRGTVTAYSTRDGLASDIIMALHEDRHGDLWIGTTLGLSRMRGGTTIATPGGLSHQRVHAIGEDRDGNLWIGTETGLSRYSGGTFTSFGPDHRLSTGSVVSVMEDREGSMWVGTVAAGVSQLRPSKFVTIGRSEGLNADVVWTVREAIDGSLLMGTDRGMAQWKDGSMTGLTVREGLASDVVRSVTEDRAGGIWLGTNEGLNLYKQGKVTVYGTADGLPNNQVTVVSEDRQGSIWIGTRGGGLIRYRDGAFKTLRVADGLASDIIRAIDEDRDGTLWVGTNDGISVMKNGVFTNYTTRDGLSSGSIRSIYHDRQGNHWIGTYGGGLNRMKDGRITPISVQDGLTDEVVFAIVEDRSGYLWMTCNRGIFRVSLSDLNDFADGRIKRIRSMSFNAIDGMKAAECNAGAPGAWAGRDGRLYFATVKGVAVIDPNHIAFNTLVPRVWNEEVLLDGKDVQVSGTGLSTGLVVGPGQHSLEIHYTALSFIAPARVQFRYRLRGFSDAWVEAGNRRTAFYTNLPPGIYTFEVMGSNNDGVWGNAGNPLQLQFRAAFFQTLWFRIACGVGLLLAVLAAFRVRLSLHRESERRLVSRVAEQTAELSAGKDAAEAVAEINTLLRLENELILNSIADGVYVVDRSGTIIMGNPAAARMLGWEPTDLVGRSAHETMHHSTLRGSYPESDCPIVSTLADGALHQVSHEVFWRKDGSWFPVHYLAAPILDSQARVTGVAVTFRDVTEQKAVERLKDEFVSTVSHELRTPLTSIRGALGLLSSGVLGPVAEKGQRMLQIAVSNTDRLVRLINDILDLERIESEKVDLILASVDANGVMVQASEGLQAMADESGVRLVVVPSTGTIRGDSDRIIQTLTNLLGNAIKFSARDTTVTLSGTTGTADFAFCVADQGRGVPVDKLETIFDRFSQVDASDSRSKGGSGLGLAICQSIIKAHGGRIWAERNDPAGSKFQFTIPLADPALVALPVTTIQDQVHSRGASILIVEDDLDLARVMATALQGHGFRTLHAGTGGEAIRICGQHQPTLIVLDLVLPDMDGFAIVNELRKSPNLARVPLLVYSALDVSNADQPRLRLGPTEFLTKSRGSLADFERHVGELLHAVAPGTYPSAVMAVSSTR